MARITVEDCLENIDNIFEMVLVAAKRARRIAHGADPMVELENDKPTVLAEMARVVRPGGRLVVAVWDALEHAPGYYAVTQILARLFGNDLADLLRSPYSLGDADRLERLFAEAGVGAAEIRPEHGTARFPSIRRWMECDVRGWTLADKLDDDQFEQLVSEAERELGHLAAADGSVAFTHPALMVTADKPVGRSDRG